MKMKTKLASGALDAATDAALLLALRSVEPKPHARAHSRPADGTHGTDRDDEHSDGQCR